MARYIGPKCKLSRREGTDLFLKSGARALDSKCKAENVPGQHGQRRGRLSDYGLQLSGGLRHGLAEPVPVGGVAARRESAAARRRQRRRFGRHPIVQGVRQPLLGQRRFRRTPGLLRIPGRAGGVLRKQSLESLRDFAPFDVILDPVGARYAGLNLELLRRDGRWVIIGLMGGREAQLDLAQLLGKRIQLTGSTLRTRDAEFKAQLIAELGLKVWPLFSAGKLRAQLERTFPIVDAEAAFEALASNQVQGKVVLVVDPSLA